MWPFSRKQTPQWLRRRIAELPERAAIAEAFEDAILARKDRTKDVWYNSQKKHWLGWLSEYDGPGYYGRSTWVIGPERVYNRIVNPSMLVWLAEASGVPPATVQKAATAALAAPSAMSAQSAAIRRVIPWEMIAVRLK
jgi:hypothetical protein